jgi:hypothetical protein
MNVENLKGGGQLEDLGVDGKITFERILGKQGGKLWTIYTWFRTGTTAGPL